MQVQELDPLLTFKETMRYLKVSRSTLLRIMDAQKLQGRKVGNSWRFCVSDVRNFVGQQVAS